jgi:hypothetical protein
MRPWQPDWPSFIALLIIAGALFAKVGSLPDYDPAREDIGPVASNVHADLRVQDFAYILNYARRAAMRPGVSPYSVEEHRRFLRAWMGPHVGSALCFAYSPTAILVLAPLFPLPTAVAWLVWNAAGAWLAAWSVRRLAADDRTALLLGRLGLVSLNAFFCLALGQTALLTTGLIGAMALCAMDASSRAAWTSAACLFVLTMKPPLAVVAGAALLAAGHRQPVVVAGTAAVAVLAAAIGWWGASSVADYVRLVRTYDLVQADPLFRAGYVPGLMSNARNALLQLGWLDDARAAAAATLLLAAAILPPVLRTVLTARPMSVELSFIWMITAYLLFSPHLSATEDMALTLPLLLLRRSAIGPASLHRSRAILCLAPQFIGGATAVILGRGVPLLPLLAFADKLALAASLAPATVRRFGPDRSRCSGRATA